MNLPSDWQNLDESEIIERLKQSVDLSAEILTELSGSDDWQVRQAVARHDNTPDEVLKKLADDDDPDVQDAVQDRSLPYEWRYMSQDELMSACSSADIPESILETLASSKRWIVRQAVAWSPSTPESILTRLRKDDDYDVRAAATEERKLPVDWRFLSVQEKVERLTNQAVDSDLLAALATSRASEVRRAVALHAATPTELLEKLREDADVSVQSGIRERDLPDSWKSLDDEERITALRQEDVPESVLEILALSDDWKIRKAVALSPLTSEHLLERLSNDYDEDVQSAVRERNLPEDWRFLTSDETVESLKNSPVDLEIICILASSVSCEIRQAVAQNIATPEDILRELLKDHDSDVRSAAKKTLKKLGGTNPELVRLEDETVRHAMVQNPNTPPEILYYLGAEFPSEFLRNPTVELMLLDAAKLVEELPEDTVWSLSLYQETPDFLKRIVLQDERVSYFLEYDEDDEEELEHSKIGILSNEACLSIGRSLYNSRGVAILKHPNFPKFLLHEIFSNALGAAEGVIEDEYYSYPRKQAHQILGRLVELLESSYCPMSVVWEIEEHLEGRHGDAWGDMGYCGYGYRCEEDEDEEEDSDAFEDDDYDDELYFDFHGFVDSKKEELSNAAPEVWHDLAQQGPAYVHIKLIKHPKCPAALRHDLMVSLVHSDDGSIGRTDILRALAVHPECPAEVLSEIMKKTISQYVREDLAGNPNCPIDILKQLATSRSETVRWTVASNPNCPSEELHKLSRDDSDYVRRRTASNLNCPPEVMQTLAQDESIEVIQGLASNPNCPPEILQRISLNKDSEVRAALIKNPNFPSELRIRLKPSDPACPVDVLQELAQDERLEIRLEVAVNPNCSTELLEVLAQDSALAVRQLVARHPNCPVELRKRIKECVPSNPNCPANALRQLSKDEDDKVRKAVAENPNCPADILLSLSEDEDYFVALQVSYHPSCPLEVKHQILVRLLDADNMIIQFRLPEHPDCPPQVLASLSENINLQFKVLSHPNCPAEILRKSSRDKDSDRRCGVASNPNCPLDVLEYLAADKDEKVRKAAIAVHPGRSLDELQELSEDDDFFVRCQVAKNPNCPLEILVKLAKDKDANVREEARSNRNYSK